MPPRKKSRRSAATRRRTRSTKKDVADVKGEPDTEPVQGKENVENGVEFEKDPAPAEEITKPQDTVTEPVQTVKEAVKTLQPVGTVLPPPETPTRESLSPIRQALNHRVPTESTIAQLFQRRDLKGLTNISQDLSRKSEKNFQEYKKQAEKRTRTAETLISNLTKENSELKAQLKSLRGDRRPRDIDGLQRQVEVLKKQVEHAKEIEEKVEAENQHLEKEFDQAVGEMDLFTTKQEMIELLTGVSCVSYDENKTSITFRMRHLGEESTLFYELIIGKSSLGELIYRPEFDQPAEWKPEDGDWHHNVNVLKQVLPEYLTDNLTFPSNTLRNFYAKVSKSLSKSL